MRGAAPVKSSRLKAKDFLRGSDRLACEKGAGRACLSLGILVERGQGGKRDRQEAQRLFRRACNAGLKRGCELWRQGAVTTEEKK